MRVPSTGGEGTELDVAEDHTIPCGAFADLDGAWDLTPNLGKRVENVFAIASSGRCGITMLDS